MKLLRSVFLTFLLLASGAPQAYELLSTFSNSKFYVNSESFNVTGQTRSFWTMENFNSRQNDGAMQRRKQYEVDCSRMKIRVLRWVDWSEHGSDLTTIIDRGGPELSYVWYDVENNNRSLGGQLYQYACR